MEPPTILAEVEEPTEPPICGSKSNAGATNTNNSSVTDLGLEELPRSQISNVAHTLTQQQVAATVKTNVE